MDTRQRPAGTAQEQEWRQVTHQQLQFVQRKMTNLLESVSELIPESSGMTPLTAMLPEERRRYEALSRMEEQLLQRL